MVLLRDFRVCIVVTGSGCGDGHPCPTASRTPEPEQANHATSRSYLDTKAARACAKAQSAARILRGTSEAHPQGQRATGEGIGNEPGARLNGIKPADARC